MQKILLEKIAYWTKPSHSMFMITDLHGSSTLPSNCTIFTLEHLLLLWWLFLIFSLITPSSHASLLASELVFYFLSNPKSLHLILIFHHQMCKSTCLLLFSQLQWITMRTTMGMWFSLIKCKFLHLCCRLKDFI